MEPKTTSPKGDIRIVHDATAAFPDILPSFLDGKPEKTKVVYHILCELMGSQRISEMLKDFCELVGVSAAVIDMDANVLAASKWQQICTDFHRVNADSCARCIESDTELANQLDEGAEFTMYRCKNGLVDCASPIIIEGEHVANLFIGQFLLEAPDREFFREQARQFGFDSAAYMAALDDVPVVEEKRIPRIMGFLGKFAQLIATMGLDRFKIIEAEKESRQQLEELVQKRTEELDKSIHVLNQAQKVGHIGHWELDLVNNRLSWSDEVYRIFGLKPQEFGATYEAFLERIHPDDREKVNEAYTTSVKEKQPYRITHRVVRPDGSMRYVEERCEHSFDETGNVIHSLGTVHDITQQTLAQEALESLNRNLHERVETEVVRRQKQEQLLIQQSKMATMGEMLGAIAHQLKQPLGVISLNAQEIGEIFEYENGDKEQLLHVGNNILAQVKHMDATINDFRNFFSPSAKKESFSACKLAEDVYRLIEAKMKKVNVTFAIHKEDCFEVFGLPNEFKQVILNIYTNACDVFEERNSKERKIEVRFEQNQTNKILRITDTGGGIPEELLPTRLFDPYVSTKGDKGTGVGLQISKTIIEEKFHGKLWAQNVKKGAEFVIELPLTPR